MVTQCLVYIEHEVIWCCCVIKKNINLLEKNELM